MLNQKKFLSSLQIKARSLPSRYPEFTVRVNGICQIPISLASPMTEEEFFRIWQNPTEQSLTKHTEEFQVKFLSNFGPNTIAITLLNKDPNTTVIENNIVIADLSIELSSLIVDNVDLTHKFKSDSQWEDANQPQPFGFMGCNGTIIFEYITPVFLYLRNQEFDRLSSNAAEPKLTDLLD